MSRILLVDDEELQLTVAKTRLLQQEPTFEICAVLSAQKLFRS